jgi:hypothetical protein
MLEIDYQYFVALDRTLGLGPIPCTASSPAIAERTITNRRTLRTLFHLLGVYFAGDSTRK